MLTYYSWLIWPKGIASLRRLLSFGQSFPNCRQQLAFFHSSRLKLSIFRCDFIQNKLGESHLPFQLHWSLEYWQREIRQRRRRGRNEASIRESMFISPHFASFLDWNYRKVHRRLSGRVVFPCAPLRFVRSQRSLVFVSRSFRDIKSLFVRERTAPCVRVSANSGLVSARSLAQQPWLLSTSHPVRSISCVQALSSGSDILTS